MFDIEIKQVLKLKPIVGTVALIDPGEEFDKENGQTIVLATVCTIWFIKNYITIMFIFIYYQLFSV